MIHSCPCRSSLAFWRLASMSFPRTKDRMRRTGHSAPWPATCVSVWNTPSRCTMTNPYCLVGISIGVSALILVGVTLWFLRIAYRRKKRQNRPPPPPKVLSPGHASRPAEGLDLEKGHETKTERHGARRNRVGIVSVRSLSHRARAREDEEYSGSENTGDDDREYSHLFGRWDWHSHIPGVRRLWEWKLYKVRRETRHRMRRSQERYEWDYPLSRWRHRLASMFRGRRKWRLVPRREKKKRMDWESDCGSEDERAKNGELGVEHQARVEGRKRWAGEVMGRVVGWVGLEWDSSSSSSGGSSSSSSITSSSGSGGRSGDGEDGRARWAGVRERARSISLVGRISSGFRRREKNADEEMGGVVRMVTGEFAHD